MNEKDYLLNVYKTCEEYMKQFYSDEVPPTQQYVKELKAQLQAYKDKEYKLREYIKEYNTKDWSDNGNDIEYYKGYNAGCKDTIYDVNSILNEGSDK